MIYVSTLFDTKRDSRPLFTIIYDSEARTSKAYPIYLPGTGLTIYDANQNQKKIAEQLNGKDELFLNDYKQHLIGFSLDNLTIGRVYDYPMDSISSKDITEIKKHLAAQVKFMIASGKKVWAWVRGNAAPVYRDLQMRGLYYGHKKFHPIWHMDTYSGRTKAEQFAVQGLTAGSPIVTVVGHNLFVAFDWISADFRMASILSKDQKLIESFSTSDPYTYMSDALSNETGKLSRDEVKLALFQALYSMDYDNPVMEFYSGLGSWMRAASQYLDEKGEITNIFGRTYKVGGERSVKSAFNAIIQGAVATGMQACIRRVWEFAPNHILLEEHDSLVLMFNYDKSLHDRIDEIADIMCHPFRGILEDDPIFPTMVNMGRQYKKWKPMKRYG